MAISDSGRQPAFSPGTQLDLSRSSPPSLVLPLSQPHTTLALNRKRKSHIDDAASTLPPHRRRRLSLSQSSPPLPYCQGYSEDVRPPNPAPPPSPSAAVLTVTPSRYLGPEPLSINSLLRGRCRSRLYVTPLHWTSDQLQLLDCHFASRKRLRQEGKGGPRARCPPPSPTTGREDIMQALPAAESTAFDDAGLQFAANELLAQAHNSAAKRWAVQQLLAPYGIRSDKSNSLPFRCNHRIVARLETAGVFSHSSPQRGPALPFLAYLDLGVLSSLRDDSIKLPRCNRPNPPVARLRQKQLSRLQPRVETKDPYIAALLISLAQEQCYRSRQREVGDFQSARSEEPPSEQLDIIDSGLSQPRISAIPVAAAHPTADTERQRAATRPPFKVCLLASAATKPSHLYFFKACVTTQFLDKLEMPSRFSPSRLDISYGHISLAQVTRLARELGTILFG